MLVPSFAQFIHSDPAGAVPQYLIRRWEILLGARGMAPGPRREELKFHVPRAVAGISALRRKKRAVIPWDAPGRGCPSISPEIQSRTAHKIQKISPRRKSKRDERAHSFSKVRAARATGRRQFPYFAPPAAPGRNTKLQDTAFGGKTCLRWRRPGRFFPPPENTNSARADIFHIRSALPREIAPARSVYKSPGTR